jgi:hypothetical protein
MSTFLGSCGLFCTFFLLFIRFLPAVAISEVKGVMPAADPHAGHDDHGHDDHAEEKSEEASDSDDSEDESDDASDDSSDEKSAKANKDEEESNG